MANWQQLFSLLNRNNPSGFNNTGDFADSIDNSFEETNDDTLNGARVWIAYSDNSGARSERWVKIARVETRDDADYLYGHCELRNAKRSFRIDRILELADNYGELQDPKEFFEPFISAPVGRAPGTARSAGAGRALPILNLVGCELIVLAFAAECDGKFVPREANLITSYAQLRCGDLGLVVSEKDKSILKRWIKLLKPEITDLKEAIFKIVIRNLTTADELIELTDLVFEADAKIRIEETAAASLFRELIAQEFR
jgi:WYL domain